MADSNTFKVRPLTAGDYSIWRVEMEDLLLMKNLWDAVKESAAFVADESRTAKSRAACALLRMSVSEKLRELIPRAGTAKEAWEAIKKYCLARAEDRKTELHWQLAGIAQGSGEMVAEFILRAEGLKRELEDGCSEKISDWMMIGVILNGVASGYAATIEALRCQSWIKFEQLTEKLMAAESRNLHGGNIGCALPMHSPDGQHRKKDRRCFCCGKTEQLMATCPEKKGKKADGRDSGNCHWGHPCAMLFDTCASYRMRARAECFHRLDESSVRKVHAGGGEAHMVVGQGTVTLDTEFGEVTLLHVLYVLKLKANL
jgi:hypothetical protein